MQVPHTVGSFLLHSYLYYHLDTSRISDTEFDALCRALLDRWDDVQAHPHGHLVSREALSAGTGHHIPESAYPDMVRHLALKAAANANYLNEMSERQREQPMDIRFTVRSTEYSITSDANNVTLFRVGNISEKTNLPEMHFLGYFGSVAYAFSKAADHALKSSDAASFTEAVALLKDIKSDILTAVGKLTPEDVKKPKPKPKSKTKPNKSDDDDFDLSFEDDDDMFG